MKKRIRKADSQADEALWTAYRRADKTAVTQTLLYRFLFRGVRDFERMILGAGLLRQKLV